MFSHRVMFLGYQARKTLLSYRPLLPTVKLPTFVNSAALRTECLYPKLVVRLKIEIQV